VKLDSGSHPTLYKVGMKLYDINPKLWNYGVKAIQMPQEMANDVKFKFSDKRFAGKINNINLELSIICNLRCNFCWWWGENGIAYKLIEQKSSMVTKELTTPEIYNVIDQLAVNDKPSFYLSGGEPFIRKDTVDIIEYITNKGMSVITNNNGTLLTDEQLQRLAKIKNLTINFSIDGPEDVHDNIRGKGMFKKTTSTIRRLIELRGDSAFPAIKTNTTFSPWIAGRIEELARYLQDDVGVDATRMQHLWFTDKEHADMHKKELQRVFGTMETGVDSHIISRPQPDYVNKLADEIMRIQKTKFSKPIFIHPLMTREEIVRYYSDLNFTKKNRCFISWDTLLIKANGDVMFCPDEWMTDFKLGNTRTDKVKDMWQNEKAQKFRTELYNHRLFPACARCCVIND
jgi:radical SAM protein with 4Fe4S-binding SPASM domain